LINSAAFKQAVLDKTTAKLQKMISADDFQRVAPALAAGFTVDRVHFYGGVSDAYTYEPSEDLVRQAASVTDELYKQSFLAGKHTQLHFSGKYKDALGIVLPKISAGVLNPESDEVSKLFSDVLSESRVKAATGINAYSGQTKAELDQILHFGLLFSEYEVLQKPIAERYNPTRTLDSLFDAYLLAVETKASAEQIKEIRDKIFMASIRYDSPNVDDVIIFEGNDHFKRLINYIVRSQPENNFSLTYRVGGDEYGKVAWDAITKKLVIYRFDGNNVGGTSRYWGLAIGDKMIDESLRNIALTDRIEDLGRANYDFFDDMRTRPLKIADQEEIARFKEKAGSSLLIIREGTPEYRELAVPAITPTEEFREKTKNNVAVAIQRLDGTLELIKFPDVTLPYQIQKSEQEFQLRKIARAPQSFTVLYKDTDLQGQERLNALDLRVKLVDEIRGIYHIIQEGIDAPPIVVSIDSIRDGLDVLLSVPGHPFIRLQLDESGNKMVVTGDLLTLNQKDFNELRDTVLPNEGDTFAMRDGKLAVNVTTRPMVSTGFIEIDTTRIDDRYLDRDIAAIQGRADTAAEHAKEAVKAEQVMRRQIGRSWLQRGDYLFSGSPAEMESFESLQRGAVDNISPEFAIEQGLRVQQAKKNQDYVAIENGVKRSRTSPDAFNMLAHKEASVALMEQGKDVLVSYIKIQNFKDAFNTFGAVRGLGHFLGDAALAAVGKVLNSELEKQFKEDNISVLIGNAGGEFYVTLSADARFDQVQIQSRLQAIIDNDEFRNQVIQETKKALAEIIGQEIYLSKFARLLDDPQNGLLPATVHFYSGISRTAQSEALREDAGLVPSRSAAERTDELYKQAFLVGKHQQLMFSDDYFALLESALEQIKRPGGPSVDSIQIQSMFEKVLSETRAVFKTGFGLYDTETSQVLGEIEESGLLQAEYEVLLKPIAGSYDAENTIEKLLSNYREALKSRASEAEINAIQHKLMQATIAYQTPNVQKDALIFEGNDHFKRLINSIIRLEPPNSFMLTYRVGGDEYGKVEWKAGEKKLVIYRFDGNNVGGTSRQWGLKIGDKLIDESLRIINITDDIRDLGRNVSDFFDDMRTQPLTLTAGKEFDTFKAKAGETLKIIETGTPEYDLFWKMNTEEFRKRTQENIAVVIDNKDGTYSLVKFPDINLPYPIEQGSEQFRMRSLKDQPQRITFLYSIPNAQGETVHHAVDYTIRLEDPETGVYVLQSEDVTAPTISISKADIEAGKFIPVGLPGFEGITVSFDSTKENLIIKGKILSINQDDFLELRDTVIPNTERYFTQKDGKLAVQVTSRPLVSAGMIEVDTNLIDDRYKNRDVSVVQGRADGAAEHAKATAKYRQVMNRSIGKDWLQTAGVFRATEEEMKTFNVADGGPIDLLSPEFAIRQGVAAQKILMELDALELEHLAKRSRTSPSSLNIRAHKEETVNELSKGKDIVVSYLKIQNFKDVFNSFGSSLGLGHDLGDAGLYAVGNVLKEQLELKFADDNLRIFIGNAGGEFFISFAGFGTVDDQQILNRLSELINSSEFKQEVIDSTLFMIRDIVGTERYADLEGALTSENGLTPERIHFYGGISALSTDQESVVLLPQGEERSSAEIVDELYRQAFLVGKHAQLHFSNFDFDAMVQDSLARIKNGIPADSLQITEQYRELLGQTRANLQTLVMSYKNKESELKEIVDYELLSSEYEVVQKPIALTYGEDNTIAHFISEYYRAIERGASEGQLRALRAQALEASMRYYSSNFDPDDPVIYDGNNHFKEVLNWTIATQPQNSFGMTFRVGGDEYAKIQWNAATKKIRLFRFDGNNVGGTSRQWGIGIGDKLIDESLRLIATTDDMEDLGRNVAHFFNDMRQRPYRLSDREITLIERRQAEGFTIKVYDELENPAEFSRIKNLESQPFKEETRGYDAVVIKQADGVQYLVKFPNIKLPYPIDKGQEKFRVESMKPQGEKITLYYENPDARQDDLKNRHRAVDFMLQRDTVSGGFILFSADTGRAPPFRISITEDQIRNKTPIRITLPGTPQGYSISLAYDFSGKNVTVNGNILAFDSKTFDQLRDDILPSQNKTFTIRDGKLAVDVTSRPLVSAGYIDIDTSKIDYRYLNRDISEITGRADTVADHAKESVKILQVLNRNLNKQWLANVPEFDGRDSVMESFVINYAPSVATTLAEFAVTQATDRRLDRLAKEFSEINSGVKQSRTAEDALNIRAHKETTIDTMVTEKDGKVLSENDVAVAYVKIQNFKDVFNTFGKTIGQGHMVGDAGLFAVGKVLQSELAAEFGRMGISVNIGNVGSEFFITLSQTGSINNGTIAETLNRVLTSTRFKQQVVSETQKALANILGKAYTQELADRMVMQDGLTPERINFYAGVSSTASSMEADTVLRAQRAPAITDELYKQAFLVAKHAQLHLAPP
ncbi:hypothetical protein KDK77_06485, partial [bacterium]|nr:hypothetical protein [bacterium]